MNLIISKYSRIVGHGLFAVDAVVCERRAEAGASLWRRSDGVTPSLISKQVAELERRLGVKLLLRTTRKVEITDIGQRYYDFCIQILDDVEGAEDAARSLQKNPSGSVTLRAPHSLACSICWRSYRVLERIPRCAGHNHRGRISRAIDYGDRARPRPRAASWAGAAGSLSVRELAAVEWHPYASPAYLERHGTPARPSDLAQHNCLVHLEMASDQRWKFESNEGLISVKVGGSFASNSSLMLRDAVAAGIGLAMLPSFCFSKAVSVESFIRLLPGYKSPNRNLSVVYTRDRRIPRRLRIFIDFMTAWFRYPPWIRVSQNDPRSRECALVFF